MLWDCFFSINQFYDPYIIRYIVNSLELSEEQKKAVIYYFTDGKIWGKAKIDDAHKFAYYFSQITYKYHSGEFSTEEYKNLRKPFLQVVATHLSNDSIVSSDLDYITLYYFENDDEYSIFIKHFFDGSPFHWEKNSTKYSDMIIEAVKLFEQGNLDDAITIYQNSFYINPVAIKAHYGLTSCFTKLKHFDKAKQEVLKMNNYFSSNYDIANYYRQLGNTLINTEEYEAAYASFKYSLLFDENAIAFRGMTSVESKAGQSFSTISSEEVLKKASYLSYTAY